jgi:hypothetical protein
MGTGIGGIEPLIGPSASFSETINEYPAYGHRVS